MNPRKPFASKVDGNHKEIVTALEAHGVTVQSLKDVGSGVPDLLCGHGGLTVLIEIKRDYDYATTKRGKPYIERVRGKLTPDQKQWHAEWKGQPVVIARTVAEALACFGLEA